MTLRARTLLLLTVATMAVGLSGCVATDDPANSPSPSATTSAALPTTSESASARPDPSATSPSEPTSTASGVPETCEALLPVAQISERLGEAWYDSGEPVDPPSVLPGPIARKAAAGAAEMLSCRWWPELATEGYLIGYAFGLDEPTRESLVAALDDASTYTPVDIGVADAAFSTSELRGDLRHTSVYAFVGDTWIVLVGRLFDDTLFTFAEHAVQASVDAG